MMRDFERLLSRAVLSAGLLLLALGVTAGWGQAMAQSEHTLLSRAEAPQLSLAEGRAYGALRRRPLEEVLEVFAAETGLDYAVPGELLDHPVSGRFDGQSQARALADLLRRFDYVATYGKDGGVRRLWIRGLRGAQPAAKTAARAPVAAAAAPLRAQAPEEPDEDDEDEDEDEDEEDDEDEADDGADEDDEEESAARSLSVEDLDEDDLEALVEAAGIDPEDLYLKPSRGGEPRLDVGYIRMLMEQYEDQ